MGAKKISLYSYFACAVLILYTALIFYPRWNKAGGESVLGWDVSGYYWYLPSIFIYKDLKQQKFGDRIIQKYRFIETFEKPHHENGTRVIRYSSGMAIMYLPMFLAAHFLAEPLGYEADGFTVPYQFALQLGSTMVALISLWFFRKLLLGFFEDGIVAISMLLLVFGTNYLNYAAIDNALTHNWLFMLYVFLLLNTIYFHDKPSFKYAVRIGIICGLMILIRPSEIIAVLIPLLWGMDGWKSFQDKLLFLRNNTGKIAAAVACVLLVGSVQVIYWLYVTGQPLVYSYEGFGFSWLHPHFKDYMFSYRSGWLMYTPLMLVCFAGIPLFLKYGSNRFAIMTFFLLNLYIVSAWDVWWYGGMGGRAMVQSYPVLMFPLAYFIRFVYSRRIIAWVLSPVIILLAYFNIWFTYNAHAGEGLYDTANMTEAYYWKVIYRYHVSPEIDKLKDTDELFTGTPENMSLLFSNDFESDTSGINVLPPAIEGNYSASISKGITYLDLAELPYINKDGNWIRAQATFHCQLREWGTWAMPQLVVRFSYRGKTVKERAFRIYRFLYNGQTKDLFLDVKIPEGQYDNIKVFIANPGSLQPLWIDNVKVWSFEG